MISSTALNLFILILVRVSTFVALFPLFSRRQLPRLVKIGFALSLTFFWFGVLYNTSAGNGMLADEMGLVGSLVLVGRESLIGAVLALALGTFFLPAKIAGAYIGQEMGLSLASISDPGTQDSSTLVTRILEAISILMFFSLNIHHFIVLAIHSSFVGGSSGISIVSFPAEGLITIFNDTSDYGLLTIGPLLILFMCITVGLAFLNKAAPTLNVFSIGMPLRIGIGIFCLLWFLPIILRSMQNFLYRMQSDLEELLMNFVG